MTISYNLLTEPWIPAVNFEGKRHEMGILELLEHARELAGISDPSPLIEFGIHRMLGAFVADAFHVIDKASIEALLDGGKFNVESIAGYVDTWKDRFDLFDPIHPFYQVPLPLPKIEEDEDLGTSKKKKAVKNVSDASVARLFGNIPSGTNVLHFSFSKKHDDEHAICPAICARGLCTLPPFAVAGGGGYHPSINGGYPPLYVLVRGKNLFETMVLNVNVLELPQNGGNGPVAWRQDASIDKGQEVDAVSTLQGLTFQPRRVHLVPGEGGRCTWNGNEYPVLVRTMLFEQGCIFSKNGTWIDPAVAYSISEKITPVRMVEGKDIWRDTGPLLLLDEKRVTSNEKSIAFQKPAIVHQWNVLAREEILKSKFITIDVYGLRIDKQAKIAEWQAQQLSLPARIANDQDTGKHVKDAMDFASRIDSAIGSAINIMQEKATPNKNGQHHKNGPALDGIITFAKWSFWNAIEPAFNGDFIDAATERDTTDPDSWNAIDQAWKKAIEREGGKVLDNAIDTIGMRSRYLDRQVRAREMFRKKIHGSSRGTKKPLTSRKM